MIDIHCHILPGLDDGPEYWEGAIGMARAAANEGIDTIIATPHHNNGVYINERHDIIGVSDFVNAQIKRQGLPVTIVPGQVIHVYDEIIQDLQQNRLLPLNQSTKYILLELPESHMPPYTLRLLFDLQREGFIPVIAHPERAPAIIDNPDILYEIVTNGAAVQVDAGSITGANGKKIKKLTRQMIDANLIHFLASNAHDAKGFHLAEAYESLDPDTADMLRQNSERLLADEPIEKEQPERITKKGIRKFFK